MCLMISFYCYIGRYFSYSDYLVPLVELENNCKLLIITCLPIEYRVNAFRKRISNRKVIHVCLLLIMHTAGS